MHWRDFRAAGHEGPWQGLDWRAERADLGAGAPVFRVCANRRRMRVECAGEPVLWAHTHDQHFGLWRLLSRRSSSWAVVPSVTSGDVRAIDAPPHSEAWWRAWARWFARELVASPRTPLHAGRWALTPARPSGLPSPALPALSPLPWLGLSVRGGWDKVYDVAACLDAPTLEWASWGINGNGGLVRTRASTPAEGSRPRAYAKQARDGTLAPLLVQYVSGLDLYLLLDGHDRLRAALFEGAPVSLLVLWRVRHAERTAEQVEAWRADALQSIVRHGLPGEGPGAARDVDRQNRLLVGAFDDELLSTKTSAWPLVGGRERWEREVIAEGVPPDHGLLRGAGKAG
ncbi:MAG TPA: hypothetical protein VFS00_16370 [Polyangiaceae bacterium]|nr:hypothetical protein [Polyangiaceae bacterium]